MALPPSQIAHCARHYESPADLIEGEASTWLTRGVNILVAVTAASVGASLDRQDNPDEYMAVLPAGVIVDIHAGAEIASATGPALIIIPPGKSSIRLPQGGRITRIFTTRAAALAAKASNAADYRPPVQTKVTPLVDWPAPPDGFRIRVYDLDAHEDINGPRIQPRVFRSTNIMINAFVPWRTRRDPRDLSPHWHKDFEQASVAIEGNFIHHIRYPWDVDSTEWADDQHLSAGSPSVAIIPPLAVHTTQDVGNSDAWLVDAFAPPRLDFALKPGFVLNENDYPLPQNVNFDSSQSGGALLAWQRPS